MKVGKIILMVVLSMAFLILFYLGSYEPVMKFVLTRRLAEEDLHRKMEFLEKFYTPMAWMVGENKMDEMNVHIGLGLNGMQILDEDSLSYRFRRYVDRNWPYFAVVYLIALAVAGKWLWKNRLWLRRKFLGTG